MLMSSVHEKVLTHRLARVDQTVELALALLEG